MSPGIQGVLSWRNSASIASTIDGLNVKLGVEEAEHGVSQLVIDADRGSARDSNTEIALAGSIAERPTQPSIPS
jgi:hypothetical protein